MRPSQLIKNIREPPPESLVGYMTRYEGRVMRNMPFVILFNLAWIFLWPLIARQLFLTVILPTIVARWCSCTCTCARISMEARRRPAALHRRRLPARLPARAGQSLRPGLPDLRLLRHRVLAAARGIARIVIFGSAALFALETVLLGHGWQTLAQRHDAGRDARRSPRCLHRLHRAAADGAAAQQRGDHAARDAGRARTHRPRPA